jgi:single-stranded-DNA-specific exonuclease
VAEGRALHFGGHANAVGITIPVDVFPEFREAVRQAFGAHRDPAEWQTEITVDTHLDLEEASESLVSYLEKLEPHGQGNPEPVFFLQSVEWDGRAKRVGENGLRFELEQKGRRIGAVGWSQAGRDREDRTGFFDVVATLQRDWLTRQPALKVLSMARPLPPA